MLNHKLFFSLCLAMSSIAQTPTPPIGDVTVRLTQGLDSATGRTTCAAVVMKSSNPEITKGTSAVVQIVSTPSGALSVQLVRLSLNGQAFRTASSAGELSGGLMGKINKALQNSATGSRILLPQGTDLQFTLAQPPSTPVVAAVPTGWKVRNIENGGHEAFIIGAAESGGRRSKASLGISCTVLHDTSGAATDASVDYQLRIPRAIVNFSIKRFKLLRRWRRKQFRPTPPRQ